MAVPWLRLLDAALGIHDFVRVRRSHAIDDGEAGSRQLVQRGSALRGLESRLASVVVAALRETFDRDSKRLEFERQQLEITRVRAERALRLELARQAADREIARARFITGTSAAIFVATLFFATRLIDAPSSAWIPRVVLGLAWLLLLAAIGSSLSDQSRLARLLDLVIVEPDLIDEVAPPARNTIAQRSMIAGLALVALAVLLS
jgi:hypothetical protein